MTRRPSRTRRRERLQAFEGVCIARQGAGLNESFTVRKISYGEGVERVFPIYSPLVDSVRVVRKGKVRRAKLYYLRGRTRQVGRASPSARTAKPSRPKRFSHGSAVALRWRSGAKRQHLHLFVFALFQTQSTRLFSAPHF